MPGRTSGSGSATTSPCWGSSTTCQRRRSRPSTPHDPVGGGSMHRTEYVLKRIAFALMTVLVAITINFILFHALPGSAVTSALRSPHATPEMRAALTHEFGLDKSLIQQYVLYLKQLFFHGNMGVSFVDSVPVTQTLRHALANTIPLVLVGTFFAIAIGIITGFLAAWRRSGVVDVISTNSATSAPARRPR